MFSCPPSINKNKDFLMMKENLLVSCYDIIMELRELSESSEDYIVEMLTKLGLITYISMTSTHIFIN